MSDSQEETFFIGNLHFEAKEADLTAAFQGRGHKVSTVKVARDREENRSRGFGFATVLVKTGVDVVEDMYGVEIMNRPIRIAISTSGRSKS